MTDSIRLSKRLIELIGCSRSEADRYIEGGWVSVDGIVVEEPQFKVSAQQVALLPGATPDKVEPVTLLLHHPSASNPANALQLISPASLCDDFREGSRALNSHFARLSTALPLQADAAGLLVFTQDWRTLRKLTEDSARLEQEYIVEVAGEMPANGLKHIQRDVPVKASWQSENRLRLTMKKPAPDLIATLCASLGLSIVSMKRIRIGGVSMGKLPVGQWRYVSAREKF